MIDSSIVAALAWGETQGELLRDARGGWSRKKLAEMTTAQGYPCSSRNIERLEQGLAVTVPTATLQAILRARGKGLEAIYPGKILVTA